jgi:hypothetical protein
MFTNTEVQMLLSLNKQKITFAQTGFQQVSARGVLVFAGLCGLLGEKQVLTGQRLCVGSVVCWWALTCLCAEINCSTKCLNQDGRLSKISQLALLASIAFRISAGVRISENNSLPCPYEILPDQYFQSSGPVSMISKSWFPRCANFQIPLNFSEATLDLLTGHPFEFGKMVYNHVLSWKWKARSMRYGKCNQNLHFVKTALFLKRGATKWFFQPISIFHGFDI